MNNAYSTYQEAKKEIKVDNFKYSNIKKWIGNYSHKQKVEFAVYCAELVIDLYAGTSEAPKKAIQAAKDWLLNPSKENKQKCKAADAAADAAASSAAAADAAYASVASSAAAAAAAYASVAAAYASVAAAAASVAAADAKKLVKEKIVNWILSKYEQTETPEDKEAFEAMDQDNEVVEDKAVEWKNGDDCVYDGESFKFVSKMPEPESDYIVIWRSLSGVKVVYHNEISKPKTEREAFILKVAAIGENTGITNTGLERLAEMLFDAGCRFDSNLVEGE